MTLRWRSVHVVPPVEKPLKKFDRGGLARGKTTNSSQATVFPTRSPDEIANALLSSQTVSLLELNVILNAQETWTKMDMKGVGQRLAQSIAHILQMNKGLYNDCVWRALYSRINQSYFFPSSLVSWLFRLDKEDSRLFKALYEEDFPALVQASISAQHTPHQLLKQFHLPLRSDFFPRMMEQAINYYVHQSQYWQLKNERWLIACLQSLLIEQRHQCVNHLLAQMMKDTLTQLPNLQEQLYKWYPQRSQSFGALSPKSQQLLHMFDTLRGWNVFELFTEKLFGYRVRDAQKLFGQVFSGNDKRIQARHALSRMGIWSNYTSHMEQVKFFVPHSFKATLIQYPEFRSVDSTIIQYLDIATPCLVFHIAHVTVVQYLWSPHGTTDKKYGHMIAYQQTSMLPTPNGVDSLREMYSVKCYGQKWQKHLYEFIRDTLRLRPNEGWTEFRGYPKKFINSSTGLPQ